jgi:hypothetical protein
MEGQTIEKGRAKVLRGGLLVQDVFVIRRVMGWYFSLPVIKGRVGPGGWVCRTRASIRP